MKLPYRLLLPAIALLATSACSSMPKTAQKPESRAVATRLESRSEHWMMRDLEDKIERQFER